MKEGMAVTPLSLTLDQAFSESTVVYTTGEIDATNCACSGRRHRGRPAARQTPSSSTSAASPSSTAAASTSC